MAFPTTISTLVSLYSGCGGPFRAANGSVYVVTRSSTGLELHVFKASDPSSSFAAAGTDLAMTSGNQIRQIGCMQGPSSEIIYIVTRDSSSLSTQQIRFHAFDMSTDTWVAENQLVRDTYTIPQLNDESPVRIGVIFGALVVLYEGPQVLADVQRARCYYARQYSGSGWSADFACGGGGNAHWYPGEMVVDYDDRCHLFLHDSTNFDAYHQTIRASVSSIEALPSAFDTSIANDGSALVFGGVAYSASAGGTVIRMPYFDSFGPATLNDVRFTAADSPSPNTITTDITGAVDSGAGSSRHHGHMVADGATTYMVFEDSNDDLYVMSSQDAGAWSTPSLIQTAQCNGRIYANVYNRLSAGGSTVIGIVYFESVGSAVSYTEYTISAVAAAPSALGPSMALLGVGR